MNSFRKTIQKLILIALYLLFYSNTTGQHQTTVTYSVTTEDGKFKGTGVEWILDRADTIRFLLFGEQHGVSGVAEFVTAMMGQLLEKGFNTLVLETDGWTTQKSAELGIDAFTRNYPYAIAFDSNGDLKLMQAAIDLQNPVWGLDQMQTAIHPFQRLIDIATTPTEKRLARGAYLKAVLKMGNYSRQDHHRDLDALEDAFSSNDSEEKNRILKELRQTIEIFSKWRDPVTRQESVEIREQLMKNNFDHYLKEKPDAKPIFKMGGAHTMYGLGPNGVYTLGHHVNQVAAKNSQSGLSISLVRFNPETSMVPENAFGENTMLLLDTKAMLERNPGDSTNKNLTGFDAIIYFKDAGYPDKSISYGNERDFRNRFIRSLLPLILSLFVCGIATVTACIRIIHRKKKNVSRLIWIGIASLSLIVLVAVQVMRILKYPAYNAVIAASFFPLVFHILFGLISLGFLSDSVRSFRRADQTLTSSIFYTLFAMGFSTASYCLYYWNIGGMLG